MTFEGRLDTPSSLQVGRDMQVLYDCEGHDIILDCTNLEYITSSGMRHSSSIPTDSTRLKMPGIGCLVRNGLLR